MILTIFNRGWAVIPAVLRKKIFHPKPGKAVLIVGCGGVQVLKDPLDNMAGKLTQKRGWKCAALEEHCWEQDGRQSPDHLSGSIATPSHPEDDAGAWQWRSLLEHASVPLTCNPRFECVEAIYPIAWLPEM